MCLAILVLSSGLVIRGCLLLLWATGAVRAGAIAMHEMPTPPSYSVAFMLWIRGTVDHLLPGVVPADVRPSAAGCMLFTPALL
jgi:hypothetical protein